MPSCVQHPLVDTCFCCIFFSISLSLSVLFTLFLSRVRFAFHWHDTVALGSFFCLAILSLGITLAWHYDTRKSRWSCRRETCMMYGWIFIRDSLLAYIQVTCGLMHSESRSPFDSLRHAEYALSPYLAAQDLIHVMNPSTS